MDDGKVLRHWFDACRADLEGAAETWRQATSAALDAAQSSADSMRFANRLYHAQRALDRIHPMLPRRFVELLETSMAERSRAAPAPLRGASLPDELALVDDEVVNESIEVSRIAARVLAEAEWDIREAEEALSLRIGRPLGGERSSPFHPEVFARTVWRLTEEMSLGAEERAACLRAAPAAITDFARTAYASAIGWCGRGDPTAGFVVRRSEGEATAVIPVDVSLQSMTPIAATDVAPMSAAPAGAPPLEARDHVFRDVISGIDSILTDFRLTPELKRVLSGLQMAVMRFALGSPETLYVPGHRLWTVTHKLARYAVSHCLRDRVAHDDFVLFGDHTIQGLLKLDVKSLDTIARHLDAIDAFVRERPDQLADNENQAMAHFARLEDRRRRILGVAINRHRDRISGVIGHTEIPFRLRQFMLADWAEVLARTQLDAGPESGAYAEYWQAAERIVARLRAGERTEAAGDSDDVASLLEVLDRGMATIAVPSVEKHELSSALIRPGVRARMPDWQDSDFQQTGVTEARSGNARPRRSFWGARDSGGNAWCDTSPSTMGLTSAVPAGDAERWIDTLRIGSVIELFLLGAWFEARVVSISAAGNLFMFEDELGGGSHSLTRRALLRLVREGLAGAL